MNKENFNKMNSISMIVLMITMLFIVPMNFGYAEQEFSISPTPKTVENVQNTCGAPVNVKDSLIMSIVTICIPGMLEKVKEWKEISCETAVCKYSAIQAGIDPSFCEKQKEYKFCKFVWGELFVIPPLSIIEMYKDMLKELIANPVGILYSVGTQVARDYLTGCNPGCDGTYVLPAASFLFVVDFTGTVQTIKDMFENGFDGGKVQQNYCEQARDIKVKLEKKIYAFKVLNGEVTE